MFEPPFDLPIVALIFCVSIFSLVTGFAVGRAWQKRGGKRGEPQAEVINSQQTEQWLTVEEYTICVHQIFEERVKNEMIVYANVEYRNTAQENLSCRSTQWSLFDVEGYAYNGLSQARYFADKGRPRLNERIIAPGMKLRGWLAFKKPAENRPAYLQFLPGYLSKQTAEFSLDRR